MPDNPEKSDDTVTTGISNQHLVPKIWHIILIAFIAIVFTAVFISEYELLNEVIWFDNDFVTANPWMIPVGVLGFSLLVGLCQKYLHVPTVINGSFVESIKESGEKADYRTFPGAFLSSFFSLLSGASVGPEGTIAILVGDISSYIREKMKIANESASEALGFDVAAVASAFNGIIGSVLFTGVFTTEFQVGVKKMLSGLSHGICLQELSGSSFMWLSVYHHSPIMFRNNRKFLSEYGVFNFGMMQKSYVM